MRRLLLTYRQISVLKNIDGKWAIYGPASYSCIHNRALSKRLLDKNQPEWRFYLSTFRTTYAYPTITSLPKVALLDMEKSGPCIAKGPRDKIWELFMSHVRML